MIALASLLAVPLLAGQGFELPYFPPDHWIVANTDAHDAYWVPTQTAAHSGAQAAGCGADYDSQNLDYLITPRVIPRAETGDTLLTFWVQSQGAAMCSVDVMISLAEIPAPSSFSVLTIEPAGTTWQSASVALADYCSLPIYLAFRARDLASGQRVLIDDISLPESPPQPVLCNGILRTRSEPTQQRLLVWGTHEEMGYAQGFLLAEQCVANMTRFVVGSSLYHWWTPSEYENQVLPYFRTYFAVPAKYQEEAEGLYAGIQAKGVSLFHPSLNREVMVEDLLCVNAMGDFQGFNCSSNSGWGESTAADDTLEGGLVIARNFEFSTGQDATLGITSLIVAHDPTDPGEQRTASVSFAGYFGCTSIVNEHGVGAFIDNGNYPYVGTILPGSLIPFGFSLRNAVEDAGTIDVFGIASRIDHTTSRYAYDTQLVSPFDDGHPTPAAILEMNNLADSLRVASDNGIAPVITSGSNLVVTNHHRVLYPPAYCQRYEALACSLNASPALDTQRAFRLQDSVAWWMPAYLAGTLHSVAVRTNVLVEHPSWPCVLVSYATRWGGAHMQPRHAYSWHELFLRDAQPPDTVCDLTVTPLGGDLLLSWTEAGDDVGVCDYRVYRSPTGFFTPDFSTLVGSSVTNQWTDPGAALAPTGVFYRISARDAAMNEGPASTVGGAVGFAVTVPPAR